MRYLSAVIVAIAVIISMSPVDAATVLWTSTYGGDWSTASNWSSNPYLPKSTDDVYIAVGGTWIITHNSGTHTVRSLSCDEIFQLNGGSLSIANASQCPSGFIIAGGTLTGAGAMTIGSSGYWTSGVISNAGGLTNNGTWEISGTSAKTLSGTLNNNGTINHNADIDIPYGGLLDNKFQKTYEIKSDTGFTNSAGTIINGGTFKKSNSSGTSDIYPAFNNNATLLVTSGTVQLWGGGTSTAGVFHASANNSNILFRIGTYTMTSGCDFTGPGTLALNGGTITLPDGEYLYNHMTGNLKLTGGALTGIAGKFYNRGNAEWTDTVLANFGDFRNEWTLTINGANSKSVYNSAIGNYSTLYHMGTGSLVFSSGSQLHNMNTGEYILYSDAGFLSGDGTGQVVNNGILKKAYSYATSSVETQFTNNGTIDIDSGTLSLLGGGTFNNGWVSVMHPADFRLSNGQYTLNGTMTFDGSGYANMIGGTVNMAYGATAKYQLFDGGLLMAGTIFTGQGNIVSSGKADWSLGTVAGGAHLINDGSMTISGTGSKYLQSAQFYNQKDILQTSTGNLWIDGSSFMSCTGPSTYEFRSDSGVSGTGYVNNGGVWRKNYSFGTTIIEPAFNNEFGSFDIVTGNIKLIGGGTWHGGSANIAGNCGLTLATGTYTLNDDFQASGTGSVNLPSGTVNLTSGAMAKFGTEQGLHLSGANINGPGAMFNTKNADWSAGTMAGDTRFTNQGTMSLIGSGAKTLRASKFYNSSQQTILHTGSGALDFKEISTLDNAGTYDIRADSSLTSTDGGSVINNGGIFQKIAGSGITTIQPAFNNTGFINVNSGTVRLAGGGEFWNGSASVQYNSKLDFTGGLFKMMGQFTASGDGSSTLSTNMSLDAGATADFDLTQGFRFTGGSITGQGIVNNRKNAEWYAGTIAEYGTLANYGTLAILSGDVKNLRRGRLLNFGIINHQQDTIDVDEGSSIEVAGGTYNLMNDVSLVGGGLLKNVSTFKKSTGLRESLLDLFIDNLGTIEVASGALILRGPVTQIEENILTGGTWQVNDGCVLEIENTPYLATNRGTVILGADSSFRQIERMTNNEGVFRLLNGRSFVAYDAFTNDGELEMAGGNFTSGKTLNTGTWKGYGVIIGGLSNRGIVEPASGGNSLALTGSYYQYDGSTLKVNLTGSEDQYYGKIITNGTATLGGTLQITLAPGFTPEYGQKFIIIDAKARSGKFSTITAPALSGGLAFNPIYTSFGLVLVVGYPMPASADVASLTDARQYALDSWISVPGIVSAAFSDNTFYVQDASRTAGLRVVCADVAPTVGEKVQINGRLAVTDTCLSLEQAQWAAYPDIPKPPVPFYMSQEHLGGVTLGHQDGIWDGIGLNNIGLLVKITGTVTYVQPYKFAYVDDGSGLTDGNKLGAGGIPVKGVRIDFPPNATINSVGRRVSVTGICCRNYIDGLPQRAVLVRSRADIITY